MTSSMILQLSLCARDWQVMNAHEGTIFYKQKKEIWTLYVGTHKT